MANKPLRPCRHPGCGVLISGGYCDAHKPSGERGVDSASWHWMYGTDAWKFRLRPDQLLREPFCRECAKRGFRTPATEVDHVKDHLGDWEIFVDENNLQSLCHSCHSRKTMLEILRKKSHGKPRKRR